MRVFYLFRGDFMSSTVSFLYILYYFIRLSINVYWSNKIINNMSENPTISLANNDSENRHFTQAS